jgi:heme/copper-type cytochrome/quinol oxidase subunit 2
MWLWLWIVIMVIVIIFVPIVAVCIYCIWYGKPRNTCLIYGSISIGAR